MKKGKDLDMMDKIVSLCKRRGFIFRGSEIYGGLAGTWDYGPLGITLKNNIKNSWWKNFVEDREDIYGLDAAIIMNPKVWEASGHVSGFSDPMVKCRECKSSYKIETLIEDKGKLKKIIEDMQDVFKNFFKKENIEELSEMRESVALERFGSYLEKTGFQVREKEYLNKFFKQKYRKLIDGQNIDISVDHRSGIVEAAGSSLREDLKDFLSSQDEFFDIALFHYLLNMVKCPACNKLSWYFPEKLNVMFKTSVGAGEEATQSYLRPETAQGIFVNFKNIVDSFHPKLPFGIAQIGKAFRNEIAPRDFIFRAREFEQMEVEYFVREDEWEKHFENWREAMNVWMEKIGLLKESVHELEVSEGDRAHYSDRTIDFEFDFPFGRKELFGLAYRTDYDLKKHSQASGTNLNYLDESTGERISPHVIEPSLGVDRVVLAILTSAYTEDELGGEKRTYLKLKPEIAPVKIAIFPLLKNKPELVEKAREVHGMLREKISGVVFDDNGNIGKRYRRQDEIGTPYCVTVDFDTLEDGTVTLRDRDSGEQDRVKIEEILGRIKI